MGVVACFTYMGMIIIIVLTDFIKRVGFLEFTANEKL